MDADPTDVPSIARRILAARAAGQCLDAVALPIADGIAYAVQDVVVGDRERRGERRAGWKLGYTSDVMRRQMGIASPNLGPLTDAMVLANGAVLPSGMQPKVEPEIAFVLGRDIDRELTEQECRDAVAEARLALEVVDSVWCDYRFTWAHNTADGSSAAYVVLGPTCADGPGFVGLADRTVALARNGVEVARGPVSAAMGDPFRALSWLTGQILGRSLALRRGDLVMTGGLCAAVDLAPGDRIVASTGIATVAVSR